jgi:predicted N-formylglutamate amidohydrolase
MNFSTYERHRRGRRLVGGALTQVQQNCSRLAIDCNRWLGSQASVPEISESTQLPRNVDLSEARKAAPVREIFQPDRDQSNVELSRRWQASRSLAMTAMHSFITVLQGAAWPWHVGVRYNHDRGSHAASCRC